MLRDLEIIKETLTDISKKDKLYEYNLEELKYNERGLDKDLKEVKRKYDDLRKKMEKNKNIDNAKKNVSSFNYKI